MKEEVRLAIEGLNAKRLALVQQLKTFNLSYNRGLLYDRLERIDQMILVLTHTNEKG